MQIPHIGRCARDKKSKPAKYGSRPALVPIDNNSILEKNYFGAK